MITKSISHSSHSGGRKTATARVQLVPGSGTTIVVNGKTASEYFQNNAVYLQNLLTASDLVKIGVRDEDPVKIFEEFKSKCSMGR